MGIWPSIAEDHVRQCSKRVHGSERAPSTADGIQENIARLGHSISLELCSSHLGEVNEETLNSPGIALGHIVGAVQASRLDVNVLSIELDSPKQVWEMYSPIDCAFGNLAYVPMDNDAPTLKQGLDIDAMWKRGEADDTSVHYKHQNRSLAIKRSDFSTSTTRRSFYMGSFGMLPVATSKVPLEILRLEEVSCEHVLLLDLLNTFSTTLKVVQFDQIIISDHHFQWDRILETLAGFNLEGLVLEDIKYWLGDGLRGMSDSVAWTGKDMIRNGLQRMIEDFQEEPEDSGDS